MRLMATSALLAFLYASIFVFLISMTGLSVVIQEKKWTHAFLEQWTTEPPKVEPRQEQQRFPKYETEEFARRCKWTMNHENNNNCTLLARPEPDSGEGISEWLAQVVSSHIYAQQMGCRLLLDYGPNISIEQVLSPHDGSHNWTVPISYDCNDDHRCLHMRCSLKCQRYVQEFAKTIGMDKSFAFVPYYRFTFSSFAHQRIYSHKVEDLERTLPGFQADSGMACSLESMFRLSDDSSQFEPDLFTRILPVLNRKDALVIALYIRTGQTEKSLHRDRDVGASLYSRIRAGHIANCALQQEQRLLSSSSVYSHVVWTVVTDSQDLKQWMTEMYDNRFNHTNVTREVVTTSSRGLHTRSTRGPSTADVAEAFIDWYLIGESDLVIADEDSPSYGGMAALRTARPYYDATKGTCTKSVVIHTGTKR